MKPRQIDLPQQADEVRSGEEADWLFVAGIFTVGVIGGGLIIASIVFAIQNSKSG